MLQFEHIHRRSDAAWVALPGHLGGHQEEGTGGGLHEQRSRVAAKEPRPVRGHDFAGPEVGRVYPYGVYDVGKNEDG